MGKEKIKIVFMGTPAFAACSLKKLTDDGYDIPLVITQPDKRGNRNKMVASEVKNLAAGAQLDIAQPARIRNDDGLKARLRDIEPDMIVVAAFGQILPKDVLDIPRFGCINVHASLLPRLRGASPMQAAILEGLDETGVTIMRMGEGLDTGDMISKVRVDIKDRDINEVSVILAEAGAELLSETIPDIVSGRAVYEPQDEEKATYSGLIKKSDGYTDFNESAVQIERKIRAYADWPSCYTYMDGGLQLKLYRAEAMPGKDPAYEPGTVSAADKNSYTISCLEGSLRVFEQQLQGKKRMSAGDFMRGRRLVPGDRISAKEDK